MDPLDIQKELKRRKISQASIARDVGVSPMSVSLVVNKAMVSNHIMLAVAEAIETDHRRVFSEYFTKKAQQKRAD